MHPSTLDPGHDVIEYRDDGGYLLMRDSERRQLITWIEKTAFSTYAGYADVLSLLQGKKTQ
jgi:hypothetical protein